MTNDNPDPLGAIECPACGHLNEGSPRFCRGCGAPQSSPGYTRLPETVAPSTDIAELRNEIARLATRMDAIESHLGLRPALAASPRATTPPASSVAPPTPPVQAPPGSTPTPISQTTASLAAQAPPPSRFGWFRRKAANVSSVRDAASLGNPYSMRGIEPPKPRYWSTIDWEAVMGRNWFAIIGSIALAIGAAFFLRLAIDNDWIGETGRVVLGFFGGLVLLGLGEYTAKRVPRWSQPVTGGGVTVLYLSIYAAFGFYALISPIAALAVLLVVVSLASLLAIRYDSTIIALMSIVGAFLTPVLLGSDLSDRQFVLLGYILVIDLGILAVSTFRNWRWFTLIGLVGTYSLFGAWVTGIPDDELILAQIGVSGAFLIFAGATTLFHVAWRRAAEPFDLALMTLNAVGYYTITFGLLWADYEAWFGIISLCLALFYGAVGLLALNRSGTPAVIGIYTFAIALLFLTLAVPLQLKGNWITIAWAVEGAILVWVGFATQSYRVRLFALGVLAVAVFRLLTLDTFADGILNFDPVFDPVANERFPTFVISILAFYIAAFLYRRGRGSTVAVERDTFSVLLVTANVLTLWILTAEIFSFYERRSLETAIYESQEVIRNARISTITATWALYAMGLLAVAFRQRSMVLRGVGVALVTLVTAKSVLYDTFITSDPRTSDAIGMHYAFVAAIAVFIMLLFSAFITMRHRDQLLPFEQPLYSIFIVGANIVGIWTLSAEFFSFFQHRALSAAIFDQQQAAHNALISTLTITWAIYAAGLVAVGFRKGIAELRFLGIGLAGVAATKFILFDTTALNPPGSSSMLGVNFYFLSAVTVLAALVFVAFMVARHRDQLFRGERNLYTVTVVLANFVALWGLSVESWRFLTGVEGDGAQNLQSAKQLSLTVLWTVYSVGLITVGVLRGSRTLRLAGIALILLPVAKLFAFDIFLLETGYRVAAFVSLGIMLLTLGLAYQRYSDVFRGFFMAEQENV